MKKGYWIVVDGVEGVGKSTLCKWLTELYSAVYVPTNTQGPIASAVRDKFKHRQDTDRSNFAYGLWMLSSIIEAYEDRVKPNLNEGTNVVSDRWLSSLYSYQIYGKEPVGNYIHSMFLTAYNPEDQHEVGLYHMPDLYIYCTASVETIMKRLELRGRGDSQDTMTRADRLDLMYKFDRYYDGLKTDKIRMNCEGSKEEVFRTLHDELLRRGYLK